MSVDSLNRLIAEAAVLASGKHECAVLGHDWRSIGGRPCPYADPKVGSLKCSQAVYECRACGAEDYGDPGGPAHRECIVEGPCTWHCEQLAHQTSGEQK